MAGKSTQTPLIAVTTYGRDEKNEFHLPSEYVDSVRRAGGLPLLIAPGEPRWTEVLDLVDGLVLTGGGDLDPAHYGGEGHETVYMVDAERDSLEMDCARRAVDADLPTLGICRGTQILNVCYGGTLIPHLPDVVGEDTLHRLPPREPTPHEVTVRAGTRLAEVLGELKFSCSSWHHQAVRDVAPGWEVTAHAPDGTIEALELPSHPWLIAVQWHPELTAAKDPIQHRLFKAFVDAARRNDPSEIE